MIDHAVPRTRRAPAANANANLNADAGDGREVGPSARAGACRQFHRAIAPAVAPGAGAPTEMIPPGAGGSGGSAGGRLTETSAADSSGVGSPETAAAPASTAHKPATILV